MTDFYDKTRGKWPGILAPLGVDISGKHGPCPVCGGTDRFRFDDKHSDGDYYCLGGDTMVQTIGGERPIRELAGGVHRVLTTGGTWVDAPFYHHGKQRLYAIHLRRNMQRKTIMATAEHRWFIRAEGLRRTTERTTNALIPGHRLQAVVPQPATCEPDKAAIRHGYVFGDGTIYNGRTYPRTRAIVYRASSDFPSMLKCFEGIGSWNERDDCVLVHGLPEHWKSLPSIDGSTNSYILGFIIGLIAADGTIDEEGSITLYQKDRAVLQWVRDAGCRCGLVTHPIRSIIRNGYNGRSEVCFMSVSPAGINPKWMPHEAKRRCLEREGKAFSRLRWVVESVEDAGVDDDVFCPSVPGTHAFALADNLLTGNCNGCGAGKGMQLYQQITGLEWRDAAREIDRAIGTIEVTPQQPRKDPRPYLRKIQSGLIPISDSQDAIAYLESRNLPVPPGIKAHPGIDYFTRDDAGATRKLGTFPAMVGKVVDVDAQPVTLHVTYLQDGKKADVPKPKKLMPVLKPYLGSAIRLFPFTDTLGIAEGIETALACFQRDGIPTWSAICDQGLARFQPPETVKTLIIYGDHDASFAGQAASYALAKRECKSRQVYVCIPPKPGDWADEQD